MTHARSQYCSVRESVIETANFSVLNLHLVLGCRLNCVFSEAGGDSGGGEAWVREPHELCLWQSRGQWPWWWESDPPCSELQVSQSHCALLTCVQPNCEGWIRGLFQNPLCGAIGFSSKASKVTHNLVGDFSNRVMFPGSGCLCSFVHRRTYVGVGICFLCLFLIVWLYYSFSKLWRC